jgi:hypothetical protein
MDEIIFKDSKGKEKMKLTGNDLIIKELVPEKKEKEKKEEDDESSQS